MTMMPRERRRIFARSGFTFVEVLAALFFLALVIPAVVGGLTVANRAAVLSERRATAGELAENKLNETLLDLATTSATSSATTNTRGDFGADRPGFRWELNTDTWDADTTNKMNVLTVEVFFTVQGREQSVRLSTLAQPVTTQNGTTTTP